MNRPILDSLAAGSVFVTLAVLTIGWLTRGTPMQPIDYVLLVVLIGLARAVTILWRHLGGIAR